MTVGPFYNLASLTQNSHLHKILFKMAEAQSWSVVPGASLISTLADAS